ncbi:MAG: V-type ATP synthase subunit K [Omnitrophica WOR_2 bacterium RIFOXYB2_FULL_38_16]|nr:MAG: V-type ATP synthase subunit K [Omnitrophica WOR_2 bacterium RIFOXYA2_FULL_38_17]OGX54962.1 MAG: V-type ATP synthase subunit K [Omnitrophica WOR_2 bacterium RIFOXYC2_FULL_38_12]OGX59474.1 MAG: V-type ATP synthase subunit K [Omnitrophica WOR_2 bacterium RIFOXYB2_FULL_38_16]HBG62060.1 V-type ATP synthase subunit K [Candidatus Omnitrophota bacterium]
MEHTLLAQFNDLGAAAAIGFSAIGSALGTGVAGMAAIGAWKKCYAQNKAAPMLLTVFSAFPLSQTLYGFILMNKIAAAAANGQYFWGMGIIGGMAIGASAYMQGKAAAGASDTFAEFGKGQGNYIIVLGIIETVAILVFVFLQGKVGMLSAG